MTGQERAETARLRHTLVRICAAGHPIVLYYVRRDQPEPPCPTCGRVQQRPTPTPEEP
jgi:hypothetical protein